MRCVTGVSESRRTSYLDRFSNTFLRDRQSREGVGPTRVVGEVHDCLSSLLLAQAVIHCPVEVVRNLGDLAGGDQRAHRDQAPISRRKIRTQPQVAEQDISGVLDESPGRNNRASAPSADGQ
jgi:hypothetical protein